MLAAGVGRLDLAQVGRRVVAVDTVDEDDAGVAVAPGVGDDLVEDVTGADGAHRFAVLWVDQRVLFVTFDGAHELLCHRDRDVEVGERAHVGLERDELFDIGVGDGEDAHVRAAPRPALLDRLRRGVEHAQEGDRA